MEESPAQETNVTSSSNPTNDPLAPLPCILTSQLRRHANESGGVLLPRTKVVERVIHALNDNRNNDDDDNDDGNEDEKKHLTKHEKWKKKKKQLFITPPSITSSSSNNNNKIVTLYGISGTGKTTVASLTCHDTSIRRKYCQGGIVYIDLGNYQELENLRKDYYYSYHHGGAAGVLSSTGEATTMTHLKRDLSHGGVVAADGRHGNKRNDDTNNNNNLNTSERGEQQQQRANNNNNNNTTTGVAGDESDTSIMGRNSLVATTIRDVVAPKKMFGFPTVVGRKTSHDVIPQSVTIPNDDGNGGGSNNVLNSQRRYNRQEQQQDAILGFGRGIRSLSLRSLLGCYRTICYQLDLTIPESIMIKPSSSSSSSSSFDGQQQHPQQQQGDCDLERIFISHIASLLGKTINNKVVQREEVRFMNDAKQIMSNLLVQRRKRRRKRRKQASSSSSSEEETAATKEKRSTLIVLDDLWNLNDVDWFRFDNSNSNGGDGNDDDDDDFEDEFHILTTTRLHAPSQMSSSSISSSLDNFIMEVGCFSLDESINLLLSGADEDDCFYHDHNDDNNDKEEEEEEKEKDNDNDDDDEEVISRNLQSIATKIASRCGNLPSAIASSLRWINHSKSKSNQTLRNALEELALTLSRSNFFESDPEVNVTLDLFESLDYVFSEDVHGKESSRVLRLCLSAFAVVFCRKGRRNGVGGVGGATDNGSGSGNAPDDALLCADGRLTIPVAYVRDLWENLLVSEIVSENERRVFDEGYLLPCKRRGAFEKIRQAFVTLGVMEDLMDGTASIPSLRLRHGMYQEYAEFLFESDLHIGISRSPSGPDDRLEKLWNNVMAVSCETHSGQWDNWPCMARVVDDHLFLMHPTYQIRGGMAKEAGSNLTDKTFVANRLLSLGILEGTQCHIDDCDLLETMLSSIAEKSSKKRRHKKISSVPYQGHMKVVSQLKKLAESESEEKKLMVIAHAMDILSISLTKKQYLDDALNLNSDCLAIRQKALGNVEDHEEIANILYRNGLIYVEQQHFDKALDQIAQALEMRKVTLGKIHPKVAEALQIMGDIRAELNSHVESIDCFSEALDVRKQTLGMDNMETALTALCLGVAKEQVECYDEALSCYQAALQVQRLVLGDIHEECAKTCCGIGAVYKKMSRYEEAQQFYRESLRIFKSVGLGRDLPDVVEAQLFLSWHESRGEKKGMIIAAVAPTASSSGFPAA